MLRYLEQAGLVVPSRTSAGYRLYGLRELNQLRSLAELRRHFGLGIGDIAFAARLRREPELRTAINGWLADVEDTLAGSSGSSASTSGSWPHNRERTQWQLRSAMT